LALAAGLYFTGPERFLASVLHGLDEFAARLQDALYLFGSKTFEVVRAAAIALFIVFFALGIVAASRGIRARGALVLVTLLFLIILDGPGSGDPIHPTRWLEAFFLAGAGAIIMTQRLISPGG
jgi:hypothetical protein